MKRHGNAVHGADRALARLRKRLPLDGLARDKLAAVLEEYAEYGRAAMVEAGVLELEAVARLYWDSMQHAADLKQFDRLNGYVKTWGWLRCAALRGWAQLKTEEPAGVLDYEDLLDENA